MKHSQKHKKLGRYSSHRASLLKNLVKSIIQHRHIITTLAKAKSVRPVCEKMITQAKNITLARHRLLISKLQQPHIVQMLIKNIAPMYADRKGGYLRIIKMGYRKGDGAQLAAIQLV